MGGEGEGEKEKMDPLVKPEDDGGFGGRMTGALGGG
jgi:hypothetical protein